MVVSTTAEYDSAMDCVGSVNQMLLIFAWTDQTVIVTTDAEHTSARAHEPEVEDFSEIEKEKKEALELTR